MSETTPEQPVQPPAGEELSARLAALEQQNAELGAQLQAARAAATSQPASAPAPVVAAPEGAPAVVPPGPAGLPQVEAEVPELPSLPRCPRCNVGYLYVTASDDTAGHESGQRLYAPFYRSGGSLTRHCFNCEWQDTVALKPELAPVNPLPEG